MGLLCRPVGLILHVFLVIVIFFFPCHHAVSIRAAGLRKDVPQNPSPDSVVFWLEKRGEEQEGQAQKVSGEEDGRGKLWLLQKAGVFLGLENYEKEMRSHDEIGSSPAPSPAPIGGEGVTESPATVRPFFANENAHHNTLHPIFILPRDLSIPSSETDSSGTQVGGSAIAVVSTIGTAAAVFVMAFFGFMIFRKKKKQRPVRTMLFSGCCGGERRSGNPKVTNSLSFVSKVGFDQGPEHFYLNTLSPTTNAVHDLKHRTENLHVMFKANTDNSCGQDQVNKMSNPNQLSPHNDGVLLELVSEEEETFHSAGRSKSSSRRVSDVSDANSGGPSLASSPLDFPEGHFSPGRAPLSPPCGPATPDSTPISPMKLKSSPSCSSSSPVSSAPQNEAATTHSSNAGPPPASSPSATPPPLLPPMPGPPLPPRVPPPPLPKGLTSPQAKLVTPSQPEQSAPGRNSGHLLPKLKPLHWDKVRAAPDHSMVWDKLRGGSFEFDEETIESLFRYNVKNSAHNEEVRNKSSSNKHVLDPKRLQNITILSKALNASPEQVCNSLMRGDGLTVEQLEALAKMAPTKEEEEKLSNYIGDISELGFGERFVKEMLNLPLAFARIEAMHYKETFEDEVLHLKKSFVMLEDACKELKSSRLFLKLLEAVLKTGNRMNDGTTRGSAKAFKLDALLKLADVKGADGKTTLLHFVVQEIIRSEGIRASEFTEEITNDESRHEVFDGKTGLDLVSRLSTELSNVKKTAGIDLDALESSVSKLSEGWTMLRRLIQEDDQLLYETGWKFTKMMKSFLPHAEDEINKLQQDEERVLHMVRRITEYFHGNMIKDETNALRIFVIVSDFLGMLDHVCKHIKYLKPSNSQQICVSGSLCASIGGWPGL